MPDVHSSLSTFGSTSSSLLRRVQSGEYDAWNTLARLYTPLVFHWVLRDGLSPDDAPDVVQEVFRSVASHVASLDLARADGTFRGWLRTVARNKVRDHFRAQKRPDAVGGTEAWQRLQDVPEEFEESADALASDSRCLVQEALGLVQAEFGDRVYQAFSRVAIEHQSPADVATALGMTLAAVYMAKSRILRRLREMLSEDLD